MVTAMEEKVIFEGNGIKVTNKRVVTQEVTVETAWISSVKKRKNTPGCVLVILIVLGVISFLWGASRITSNDLGMGAMGIISGIGCVAGIVYLLKIRKPTYSVMMIEKGSSREVSILDSADEQFIQNVVDAIKEAIYLAR